MDLEEQFEMLCERYAYQAPEQNAEAVVCASAGMVYNASPARCLEIAARAYLLAGQALEAERRKAEVDE